MAESNEYDDCGLDGRTTDPVHVGQFNKMLRRIGVHHLLPLKQAAKSMQDHVNECARLQAKISGGITVIIWMIGLGTTVIVGVILAAAKNWFGL